MLESKGSYDNSWDFLVGILQKTKNIGNLGTRYSTRGLTHIGNVLKITAVTIVQS
jgi:hypothetical protein